MSNFNRKALVMPAFASPQVNPRSWDTITQFRTHWTTPDGTFSIVVNEHNVLEMTWNPHKGPRMAADVPLPSWVGGR